MTDLRQKPRPLRRVDVRRINPYRIPEDGALTPRLRDPKLQVNAIGFHHDYAEKDQDAAD